jgi:hypothetical protein
MFPSRRSRLGSGVCVVHRRRVIWTFERRLLGAAVLAWTAIAVINLALGAALGHDESAFAIVARGDTVDLLYRSRGLALVAELGIALGSSDWQMRLASTILGIAVVPSVFAVGRAAFGARTGAWAAAVIAGAHPMVARSAQLLGDLPATAGMLAGIALVIGELGRAGGPRWRILFVAPAFAAAFYFRYASGVVIAIVCLAALAIWWRSICTRPWPIAATAAVFALLLVPHVLHSLDRTGSVLGVLLSSAEKPRHEYLGDGLVTYLTSNPFSYYGALVAPLLVAGLLGLVRRLRSRAAWFLATIALGQLLALGLKSHAQPRYVFIATALLVVLGVETLRPLARPRAALAATFVAWLGLAIATIPLDLATIRSRSVLTAAAATIRAHRSAPSCVAIADAVPQLTWYTQCEVVPWQWIVPITFAPGPDRYVISTPSAPLDGPALAAPHGVTAVELPTGNDRARVWMIQ